QRFRLDPRPANEAAREVARVGTKREGLVLVGFALPVGTLDDEVDPLDGRRAARPWRSAERGFGIHLGEPGADRKRRGARTAPEEERPARRAEGLVDRRRERVVSVAEGDEEARVLEVS